jgi:hypothetical protein
LEKKYGHHGKFLFLVGWIFLIFSSESTTPNELLLCMIDVYKGNNKKSGPNGQFSSEPSIGASYQISIKLAKCFLRRFILIGQSQRRTANDGYVGTKYRIAVQDLSNIIPTK